MTDGQFKTLEVITEFKDSRHLIQAPTVGYYSERPKHGTFLKGGAFAGKIKILNTYYDLHLPEDIHGLVGADDDENLIFPVDYGKVLFRLNPDKNIEDDQSEGTSDRTGGETFDVDVPESGHLVRAFTTGIFYAKPSPDAPTFVSEGEEIEKGTAMGLIEVMKTFNHIIFQGTDKSHKGTVKKVYVKDAQEVKLGQPLFLID
jgi:acetyl-CoA carboxylase biotin carboxyl carrier protein